tara:strand:+ start:385 stop:903 length:519 start_codon:yes stop_codon:yes gene_type:complete
MVLQLGSGSSERREGWVNMDVVSHPGVDVVGCLTDPLPFGSSSFDECWSHHVIEHLEITQVFELFLEVYRILIPGGRIGMILPDLLRSCEYIYKYHDNLNCSNVISHIYGDSSIPHMSHKWGWIGPDLVELLEKVGFINCNFIRCPSIGKSIDVYPEQHMYAIDVFGFKPGV